MRWVTKPVAVTLTIACMQLVPATGFTDEPTATLVTPATDEAIERGLAYLASRQKSDGSFLSNGFGSNAGVVALAGLAFLSEGSTPGRGRWGDEVSRCVEFLAAQAADSGLIANTEAASRGPMYGHGFATLFLAEVYGMSPRDDLRDKLERAVDLIVRTQNAEGGWRYQPRRSDADISVTVCQVMALRAARNAGIFVPHDTIVRSVEYVRSCQNADGGFTYQTKGGNSQFPRSAAAMVALHSAGIYEGPELKKGLVYLEEHMPQGDSAQRSDHYFYGQYYAAQVMWQAGGDSWSQWYATTRDTLLSLQQKNGAWPDTVCYEYGTAMACIVLQMPNDVVPIFQR